MGSVKGVYLEHEIGKLLKSGSLPYSKIFEELKKNKDYYKRVGSHSTLSKALKHLRKVGWIDQDIDTHDYFLTKLGIEMVNKFELASLLLEASQDITELGVRILEAINYETRKALEGASEEKVAKTLGSWIGAVGLYSLLEQIKKGEPFVVVAFYYLGYIGAAYATMKRHVVYKDPEMNLPDLGKLLEIGKRMNIKTGLERYDVYKPIIDQLEKALEDVFPTETKLLKQLFEK